MLKKFGVAILFMGGLALAGSDSDWFPWVNLVGIGLFIAFGVIANRLVKTEWNNLN